MFGDLDPDAEVTYKYNGNLVDTIDWIVLHPKGFCVIDGDDGEEGAVVIWEKET